jgi:hypothetical protein
MSTIPAPAGSSDEPPDPWQKMSERAKQIAKTIEEKVRKARTPAEGTPPLDSSADPTDELPPLTDESPPLP